MPPLTPLTTQSQHTAARVERARPPDWIAAALGLTAAISGLFYLLWRVLDTSTGANPVLFWLLWCAEAIGWAAFALAVRDAWPDSHASEHTLRRVGPHRVDLVVLTSDEPQHVLEPTIAGALAAYGGNRVWVLDRGGRAWVRELGDRLGASVVDCSGMSRSGADALNRLLPNVEAEFLFILRADQVTTDRAIDAMIGQFGDPRVGLVQPRMRYRNADAAEHIAAGATVTSLRLTAMLPGRHRTEAVFWHCSAAIVRTAALRDVGGFASGSSEFEFDTTLALQRRGWRVRYVPVELVSGLAPDSVAAAVEARTVWLRSMYDTLFALTRSPLTAPGFAIRTRLSYLGTLFGSLVPLLHVAVTAVLAAALLTGLMPFSLTSPRIAGVWALYVSLLWTATWLTTRGWLTPIKAAQLDWLSVAPTARAVVGAILRTHPRPRTAGHEVGKASRVATFRAVMIPYLAVMLIVLPGALRIADAVGSWQLLRPIPVADALILAVIAVAELGALVLMLQRVTSHKQLRASWRWPVDLVGRVDALPIRVVDLHESGLRLVAPAHLEPMLHDAEPVQFSMGVPSPSGTLRQVTGALTATRTRRATRSLIEVGGRVAWASDADRLAVIRYCYLRPPNESAPS